MPNAEKYSTWGKGQHQVLIRLTGGVPGPVALPNGHRTARQGRPPTCSVSVSAAKATWSRVPARPRSRARRVTLLPFSSSQRLRLRHRRSGGGERLGAGSGFPRAACCSLRRRGRPRSRRLPPPGDGQLSEPVERLAPPRCGCEVSAASGAGIVLEDPVAGALLRGRGGGGAQLWKAGFLRSVRLWWTRFLSSVCVGLLPLWRLVKLHGWTPSRGTAAWLQ